jgi:pimeloyl-ACP methyl ester carboxylesterase
MGAPATEAPAHRTALVNGVRLHYVECGDATAGRTVLLLHGFPGFWYCWRHQVPALAAAGFHVVAPDLRGYNTSDKPRCVRDYRVESLVDDVAALARLVSPGRAVSLVGHDWGGIVAWFTAMWRPESVGRLAVLNAPHPAAYLRELRRVGSWQLPRSWYVLFFQFPWLPESLLAFDDFAMLRRMLRTDPARPRAFTPVDVAQYVRAWSQPGALRAGINYYRAAARRGLGRLARDVRRIDTPTLLIWGERDRYLVPDLTRGLEQWAPNLRVERLPGASHWVMQDEPGVVSRLLVEFLS